MSTEKLDFDALKTKLSNRLWYILFVDLFNTTIHQGKQEGKLDIYIENIETTDKLIGSLSDENYDKVYPIIITPMEAQINEYKAFCLPKKPVEEIGRFFFENDGIFQAEGKFRAAIEYKHIRNFFDTKNFLPSGLPDHALIGIKDNAGAVFIEEDFVLEDAFYFLAHAEKLVEDYKEKVDGKEGKETWQISQNIRNNLCSNSRSAIQFLNNFVECFINSIGFDYYSRNEDSLSKEQKSILLKGKKPKKKYFNLERKIVEILKIVCEDDSLKLVWNKGNPIDEPYLSFFNYIRQLRNLLVHPGPIREGLFQSPAAWFEEAFACGKICMEVSQDLWKRCYPEKELPEYLEYLDFNKNLEKGHKRLDFPQSI